MDMVRHTAHAETFAAGIAGHSREIGVEFRSHPGTEKRMTVLRAENHMHENESKGLGH
jgi:hypothetical protein